jgi:hypothetical protein
MEEQDTSAGVLSNFGAGLLGIRPDAKDMAACARVLLADTAYVILDLWLVELARRSLYDAFGCACSRILHKAYTHEQMKLKGRSGLRTFLSSANVLHSLIVLANLLSGLVLLGTQRSDLLKTHWTDDSLILTDDRSQIWVEKAYCVI